MYLSRGLCVCLSVFLYCMWVTGCASYSFNLSLYHLNEPVAPKITVKSITKFPLEPITRLTVKYINLFSSTRNSTNTFQLQINTDSFYVHFHKYFLFTQSSLFYRYVRSRIPSDSFSLFSHFVHTFSNISEMIIKKMLSPRARPVLTVRSKAQ